ncbi:MAG: ABC transporter permease subunit [Clostridiales bacterium]|nr:ABC transporter permease subunit [Roseburia sp.]MDD7637113.1 ABC transporter permease subunit [Clostridiales bacterium]MDY4112357.1 ABC transporter permease subunit [Roseburia sp.]
MGKKKIISSVLLHVVLTVLAVIWLVPIIWLVVTSFSGYDGMNTSRFFPENWTLHNYTRILFEPDSVAQFPVWFKNTLIIAIFVCLISTSFVLMVSYAMSCMCFKGRKALMNIAVMLQLFPGFLSMIAIYFILKSINLTNSHIGMILVYSGGAGLGYLVAKGFFDTIPNSLREAAYLEGASEARTFFTIVLPLSKPIIVYTVISSFLVPWTDFVFARIILNSGISTDWTVAIGLYNMLQRQLLPNYFSRFCAGGVLVGIPIGILFIIMQKFYVEGITGGSVKG